MTKPELKDLLINTYKEDPEEIEKLNKEELLEKLEELTDLSDLYPNGQDED